MMNGIVSSDIPNMDPAREKTVIRTGIINFLDRGCLANAAVRRLMAISIIPVR